LSVARDRASRPEAKPLRLFVAVDVPDEVKSGLAQRTEPFRNRIPGARWTRSDSWHVTLKFLGSTWPRLVTTVEEAVAGVAAASSPFDTALTELGVFPSPRRARVVWGGLSDPDIRFAGIVRDLDERLADDFTPETRVFTPHLTLARLNPPRDIGEFAPDLVGTSVESAPFGVRDLVLYRSHLSPHGARYEAMNRFALEG
jgi:RNA 2',3'-cyclic 3'-phosphodiesterase